MTSELHDIRHATLSLSFRTPEAAADFAAASGGSARQSADNPLAVECGLVADGRADLNAISLLTRALARNLVGQLDRVAQLISQPPVDGD